MKQASQQQASLLAVKYTALQHVSSELSISPAEQNSVERTFNMSVREEKGETGMVPRVPNDGARCIYQAPPNRPRIIVAQGGDQQDGPKK